MYSSSTLPRLLLLGLVASVLASRLDHLGQHDQHGGHHDQHGGQHDQHRDQHDQHHGQHDQHHDQHDQHRSGQRREHRELRDGQQPAVSRLAETIPEPASIPIVRQDSQQSDDGAFQYGYQTGNQIQATVTGHQQKIRGAFGTVMQGQYQYISPEGYPVRVQWTADENGFRAVGHNLGLPPQL